MYHAPPDIPLSLGDLIGISFRVFREQFRFIWSAIAWPTILATLGVGGMRWSILHWLSTHSFDSASIILHLLGLILCLCMLTVAQWELSIRSVTIVRVVLGLDDSYKSAILYARRRQWAAMLLYSVAAIAPFIVMIFWGVLSIFFVAISRYLPFSQVLSFVFFAIVGLAFTCTLSWSLLSTALAFTILACEDKNLKSICIRTYDLMKSYMWRSGSFVVLLGMTMFAVTGALDLPVLIASMFDAWRNGVTTYDTPLYMEVLSTFVDSVINIFLLGVAPVANALYYNDLRMRVEGRDILLRLERLEHL